MSTPTLYALFSLFYAVLIASLLFTASLAAHELGHAAAGRLLGLRIARIVAGNGPWLLRFGRFEARLFGLTGATEFARPLCLEQARTRVLVALAGPAASLAAAAAFHLVAVVATGATAKVCGTMAAANVALAVFNLAPVPPLDGWRVLEPALERLGLRLTPGERARLYSAGMIAIAAATAVFFAWRWR